MKILSVELHFIIIFTNYTPILEKLSLIQIIVIFVLQQKD